MTGSEFSILDDKLQQLRNRSSNFLQNISDLTYKYRHYLALQLNIHLTKQKLENITLSTNHFC